MRKFFFQLVLSLLYVHFSFAQEKIDCCKSQKASSFSVEFKARQGTWIFSLPADGIIKAIYHPDDYTRGEFISNAVIHMPEAASISIEAGSDTTIEFNKSASIRIYDGKISFQFDGKEVSSLHSVFFEKEFRGFRFELNKNEQIYGGGERAIPMNRRGHHFDFYNGPNYGYGEGAANLNFSVPFLLSSYGYGIFFDNVSKGYADIGKLDSNILEAGFYSGELNFYLIKGKNINEILQRFTHLTGTQDVPARWVFGAFASRFGYRSEAQAGEVVRKMQEEKFPLDAIIFDLFWFGDSIKGTLGNLDWVNREKWNDPEKMISQFRKQGIKTVLITEPYILSSTPNYEPTLKLQAVDSIGYPFVLTDFYFGKGGLLDLFRNDTQDWFWNEYEKQHRICVAGWWGDLGEPERHPFTMYHDLSDLGFSRLFSADEVHNLYGQYWSKMLSDKYAKEYPDVRLFHLNRSGFAGSQRFHAFPWTGDVGRNWSGLRAQLPVLLGMSICGIPYVHSDAGGFAMGDKDPELYTRWLQFAVFTPIFRPHGTALEELAPEVKNIESEPVFYPEPYKSIVRNSYNLRYALMPYNYTLGYEQEKNGKPLMRPMFYYTFSNTNLMHANDQYFWGDEMLIAPVLEKGAIERKIYLPHGNWYKWEDSKILKGSNWITVPVDISNIPVFVRGGSFIPLSDSLMNMDQYTGKKLSLTYYYDDSASTYTMYDDDGKTNHAIEKNQYSLITFSSSQKHSKQVIEMKDNGGTYIGMPAERMIMYSLIGLPGRPKKISVDHKKIKIEDQSKLSPSIAIWDASRNKMLLMIKYERIGEKIVIRY